MKEQQKYGTVVLTGGGTGGHVYPNLAIVDALEKRFDRVVYIGGNGIEKRVAKDNGLDFIQIDTVKLNREFNAQTFAIPAKLQKCVRQSKIELKRLKPDVVFSKGGYVALPVVLAAKSLKIPVVCHESDLSLGLTNRISALIGAKVLVANGARKGLFADRIEVGIPLRHNLFEADRKSAREKLNVPTNKKVVLIVGGSSGARKLLELTSASLARLTKKYFVIRVIGEKNVDDNAKHDNLLTLKYSDDMPSLYAASDVVVSRAGATAVAEITALKKHAVFIPLPKGVSRGDQIENAKLAQKHGAVVLIEEYATPDAFVGAIVAAADGAHTTPCYADSAEKIVNEIIKSVELKRAKNERRNAKSADKNYTPADPKSTSAVQSSAEQPNKVNASVATESGKAELTAKSKSAKVSVSAKPKSADSAIAKPTRVTATTTTKTKSTTLSTTAKPNSATERAK